jgi:hypothetical protein
MSKPTDAVVAVPDGELGDLAGCGPRAASR